MKKTVWTIGIMMVMMVFFSLLGHTQEGKMDQDKMMEAYMKMMAVNENHELFKKFVGEWDVMTKAWMQPGSDPVEAKNFALINVILGGGFMKMNFTGTMFGQPFEGIQIVGYDNFQKKYISFWIDSSSTAFYFLSGTRDETGKIISETGVWPDPMTGGTIKVRDRTEMISSDEIHYEMYMTGPDGKEFKTIDNRMIRRK